MNEIQLHNRSTLAEEIGLGYWVLYAAERKGIIPGPTYRIGRRDFYRPEEEQKVKRWAELRQALHQFQIGAE